MKVRPLYIAPKLPEPLQPLYEIAMNLWYSWSWEAVRMFIRIDAEQWEKSYQNPIEFLGKVSQSRLKHLEQDDSFVATVQKIYQDLKDYLEPKRWFSIEHPDLTNMQVAYFSCEYGLDEGLPVYSGGLGVLSGDHLKSASDLGIPLTGIGLLYREGYFRQRLNADGWQSEEYPVNDWYNMPVELVRKADGEPLTVSCELGSETVHAQIWQVRVGKINLFLLDTNFPKNNAWGREITNRLYGGNRDMRVRQEMVLGIGGVRALKALGITPTVYHLNEGHSAFLALERIRELMQTKNLPFYVAREIVSSTNIFTTHTPVPAGNEQFDPELLKKYLSKYIESLGIKWEDFLDLGRVKKGDTKEQFGMTVLALRLSFFCNGVSKLHGHVSRTMWKNIWTEMPVDEIPISHVTNGIHALSWISHDMKDLFNSYLGPRFAQKPWEDDVWSRVERIPDVELWRTHQRRRERLVFFTRKRLNQQLIRRGAHPSEVQWAEEILDPHTLTIGFARRFATYKRANLLFMDIERLKQLLTNPERPIQLVIAGKAHPQDNPAKELIKSIVHIIRELPFRSHIAFIEDYDINVARYLVQGVDVWLNTPRRPLEASGTSGMKAAANGGLNLSILDGWWDEGCSPDTGWAIGHAMDFDPNGEHDQETKDKDYMESQALFDRLENDVVPLFYERDNSNLPRRWIGKMKASMQMLGRDFNTSRMLQDYTNQSYLPAHQSGQRFCCDNFQRVTTFADWRQTIFKEWKNVEIVSSKMPEMTAQVGDNFPIEVHVKLGQLKPEDVRVEVLYGIMDSDDQIQTPHPFPMNYAGPSENNTHRFTIEIPCEESGQHGVAIRAMPSHPDLTRPFATQCVTWG